MKFSASVMVLATLAFESASAGVIHQHAHRHAHEKKAASPVEEAKRQWTPPPGYDWHTDTNTIWKPAATPAPVAGDVTEVSSTSAAAEPSVTSKVVSKVKTNTDNVAGTNLLANVQKYLNGNFQVAGKTVLAGDNPTERNGFAWIGNDGDYVNTLINDSDDEINVVFWNVGAYALGKAQYVDQVNPAISVKLPSKSKLPISLATGASGAFAPIYPDATWSNTNWLLKTTIGEFNAAGTDTTYDVSREWFMDGPAMTIDVGNGCKSSTIDNECAYYCLNNAITCGEKQTYDLNKSTSGFCNREMVDRHTGNGLNPEGGCNTGGPTKSVITTFH